MTRLRRIGVIAPARALDGLEPLLRAYAQEGDVVVLEGGLRSRAELEEHAGDVDAILVVGPCRRSPRTAVPGPFVTSRDGRRVPVGWVPDCGWEPVRRFAETASDADQIHHRLMEFGRSTLPLADAAVAATLREESN